MSKLDDFHGSLLQDIAGNAFHTWVSAVMTFASARVVATCEHAGAYRVSLVAEVRASSAASKEKDLHIANQYADLGRLWLDSDSE